MAAAAAGEAATAEQRLAAAHETLLKTRGLQLDFASGPREPPPEWPAWLIEFLRAIGPALSWIFWGGVILGAALILFFIVRELAPEGWFQRKRTPLGATDWRPASERALALLEDADGLAAAGRFEEAIHLLLFRSIEELAQRRPGTVRPALTSRDIAGLEILPAAPRAAFARLAQAVERTFFGGRPAGADDFAGARADYEAFAFADGWR